MKRKMSASEIVTAALAATDELAKMVAEHRPKVRRPDPGPAKLPPVPPIRGHYLLSLTPEERERIAEQEARQWFNDTWREYRDRGWLDDATEAAITMRANIHYRSITGKDMPREAVGAPLSALMGPGLSECPPRLHPHQRLPAAPTPTHYRDGRWWRGNPPGRKAPLDPIGPSELRKAGTVAPRQ